MSKYGEPLIVKTDGNISYIKFSCVPDCAMQDIEINDKHNESFLKHFHFHMGVREYADRAAACVNALEGIEDPVAFMAEQRARIAELEAQNARLKAEIEKEKGRD